MSSPLSISGVLPRLAAVAEHTPRSETGIGALMPWANRLWFVTYVAHKQRTGAGTGLFEIDDDLTLRKRPESIVGTYANRLIHTATNQLIIGPHLIDVDGNVRTIAEFADHRLAATMDHLTDPDNKVYVLSMEGMFFEVDVRTLHVTHLFDLRDELQIPANVRLHFKSGHTGQGRVVVANNSYYESDFHQGQGAQSAPVAGLYEADSGGGPLGGRLAEWDGQRWTILERKPFNEATGRRNWGQVIFATGWDRASAILKVCVNGQWQRYRLPKASHAWEHCWQTEWPRIREVESERYLMDASAMFYELSPVAWDGKVWGARPICTHLRIIPDYCSWRGLLVLAGDQTTPIGDNNPYVGQPQANLWLGKTDDLWQFGKPTGWGGPWWEQAVRAGEASDPYLMTGFDQKVLHITADRRAAFTVEVDFLGNQSWQRYARLVVHGNGSGYAQHAFPPGYSAHWLRVVAEQDCTATAYLHYT